MLMIVDECTLIKLGNLGFELSSINYHTNYIEKPTVPARSVGQLDSSASSCAEVASSAASFLSQLFLKF